MTLSMVGLAQVAQRRPIASSREWMEYFRFGLFMDLEAAASAVWTYEPTTIPGLLQTAAFTEAVVRAGAAERLADALVAEQVELRSARQVRLHRENPLQLHAIIDESALHRRVGGPATMREQLTRLLSVAELPHVNVQVIPFEAGAANAAPNGGFVLLEFDGVNGFDGGMDPIAYQETPCEALYREGEQHTATYRREFARLAAVAQSEQESAMMITAARDALDGGNP